MRYRAELELPGDARAGDDPISVAEGGEHAAPNSAIAIDRAVVVPRVIDLLLQRRW
jgi:hypothetical protein